MEIKSIAYLAFCFITILFYFAFQRFKWQRYILLAADIACILLMSDFRSLCIIVLVDFLVFLIAFRIEKSDKKNSKKIWLFVGLLCTIGVLIFFKYFKGVWEVLQVAMAAGGISLTKLLTPIGISYYTLSLAGYLIDIYHGKYETEKNFADFLGFTIYFPAIIEGPINLYKKVSPRIKENHTFDFDRMVSGLQRILWGYFKKVVIADRIGVIVTGILGEPESHGFMLLLAFVLYSFQIYGDFSGGIDVIMGVSEILGIELTENFTSPLMSKNVTEYWQRWHKSLGEWMEKYIYYPLVLNVKLMKFAKRFKNNYLKKSFTAIVASFLVFIVVGIWHGTGWNYVVYGLYQAIFVAGAVALKPTWKLVKSKLCINEKSLTWDIFCILRTFVILLFGRVLIKSADLTQAMDVYQRIFKFDNIASLFDGSIFEYGLSNKSFYIMILGIIILIVVDMIHDKKVHIRQYLMTKDIVFRYFVYFVVLFSIIVYGIYGPEFVASSFIYQGF